MLFRSSNVWVDNICITKTCENVDAAYKFIDFLCGAEVGKQNIEYIGYSTPNAASLALMDEDWLLDPIFNPDEKTLEKCEVFVDLGEYVSVYNVIWERIRMGR